MKSKLNKIKKYFFILILIALLLIILFDLYISISVNKFIFQDLKSINNYQYCLLLGTSKYSKGKKINPFYQYRIDSIKLLYDNNKISKIILSGDSRERYYNETKYMKEDLLKLGIPEDNLIIDGEGFRTIYSILNLQKKLNLDKVLIVSQKFHLERAIFIGKIFNLNLEGYAAKPVKGLSAFKIQIRERGARIRLIFDILKYFTYKIINNLQ